ncbi:AfsR/SARP family transcriptional regulator [Streptomyces asoensis]|uniref:AfsR/SARP family transcriptional regulator n=1 Tax=Streptomyces asoensis TaxID=249586 RepID=A0A6M4WRV1_9ACTN|nr:BTAD domain-containing putative transcriptional regulator [Streptomyces asoensis]QJS99022.1 AfsR/SARP family transcriptional regulator [Streptomyces asoensis]QJT06447.1 AfsR/SARP family transcriptional regulator [Streptomyces asoensis]
MEFGILGSVQVCDARTGQRIVPVGAKQRALLGALVAKAGQVVPCERLVDELWGEHPPANAANALHAHVARLRRLLPVPAPGPGTRRHEGLVTRPTGYVLRLGGTDTDARRFTRLAAEGRALLAADPARSARLLREALALWRGAALQGSGRGAICSAEAALLEESRLVALEALYDACLRAGHGREITGELEELTIAHPLRERFYELLMTALQRCGRQAEALLTYERARRTLVHDLGIQPGPTLRHRMQAILHHHDPDGSLDLDGPGPHPGPGGSLGLPVRPEPATGPAGGVPGRAPGDDSDVTLLREEIAWLRRRVERLAQEQQDLLGRLDRLMLREASGLT